MSLILICLGWHLCSLLQSLFYPCPSQVCPSHILSERVTNDVFVFHSLTAILNGKAARRIYCLRVQAAVSPPCPLAIFSGRQFSGKIFWIHQLKLDFRFLSRRFFCFKLVGLSKSKNVNGGACLYDSGIGPCYVGIVCYRVDRDAPAARGLHCSET